ncbi:DNA-binding NarL/FixJ family response regulator [Agromyces flavus]|uniref:DNA-binding NarL/FixJ family response regulator n=1 Tax=Agromyces flavus TaxID=589382 RepID=A0A1H1S0K8_9MICO|nr:response regulator transcription factor [Agromyces flavus]MCP2368928.1 DNA-binding NarL/FixJ family response regulator [Agromyces flavus]GGI48384.1 DNA-binding response regulator [Agromyces flavus]SDS41554.1 DNA-binding response regulator, NarL/FixJ family, contains REC and HTH domains [Agromyces flavus]
MSAIRVALVDDQALFRAGIRMLVESQDDLVFAGDAADGRAAVALAERSRPDVMLMDVRMPQLDGIGATERILADAERDGREPPRILVLTTFDLDENAARAIRAGASGFVLKDADPEFLLAAIRTVHRGNAVIAANATRELIASGARGGGRRPAPPAWNDLTARERDIFALAAKGLSNAEIAASEYLSEATVKTHLSRVLAKLGLRDRVQLVVFAYEHDLTGG